MCVSTGAARRLDDARADGRVSGASGSFCWCSGRSVSPSDSPRRRRIRAWQAAVDQYLAGDRTAAGAILLHATPAALLESSRRAFEQWRAVPAGDAEARRNRDAPLPGVGAAAPGPPDRRHRSTRSRPSTKWRSRMPPARPGNGSTRSMTATAHRRRRSGSSARGGAWPSSSTSLPPAASATCPVRRRPSIHPRRTPKRWPHSPCCVAWPSRRVPVSPTRRPPARRPCPCVGCPWPREPRPMLIAMDDAGKQYRRALELMPGDREATLRLARVAIERDRLDDAERLLAPLLSQPCRDAVCGLAHLFAGEVHEGRKDMERAVGCVRACLRRSRGAPLRAGGDDAGRHAARQRRRRLRSDAPVRDARRPRPATATRRLEPVHRGTPHRR